MPETNSAFSLERYAGVILRRRWVVVSLTTLFMLAVTGGGRFIGVTNDYRSLFAEDNPELAAFDALEASYSASNSVLIAVASGSDTVFSRDALSAIEELTEAVWRTPYSTRVDSLTNFNHSKAFGDDLIVEPLVEDAQLLSDADLEQVKETALNSTEIAERLVSRDGRVAGIAVTFSLPEDTDSAVLEITDYLNALLEEARASHPGIFYYLTGDVVLNRAFADATKDDMEKLMPIVFLVILVTTAVLLRSAIATLVTILLMLFTVSTTVGFAGWVGTVFNPVNAGVPLIVMTVAVADSIHIITAALAGLARGLEKNAAIMESLRSNIWPVFLTSATTAGGFLTLNFSDSPPFHVLGNLVAFGVLIAFIFSITVLPALLSILPLHAPQHVRSDERDFFKRFGDFVVRRRVYLLSCFALLTIILAFGIPRNELNDNWTRYFDERYQFRRDTDFILENLTGMQTLEYSLDSGREGGITDPDYLRAVEAFAEWYREQPEIAHVQAFTDIMKRLNRNMHGDDLAFYRLPDNAELAAQYLLLYELSLPFGSDLNNRIDIAKSATRMTVTASGHVSSQRLRDLDARAQDWLLANMPDLATPATGIGITFAHLSQRNINSMLRATIIAMTLISFIFIWVFKSVRVGFISLVPNFLPAAMSFGLWGYLVGQVGLAGSVMTAIAFGIVVDDTTHFLSKYLKARREGATAEESVRYTFRTAGRALWTTTLVLMAGFLVFTFSGFEVSRSLGLMVTGTIGFALLADFLLLPPLLMLLDRKRI